MLKRKGQNHHGVLTFVSKHKHFSLCRQNYFDSTVHTTVDDNLKGVGV